MADPIKLDVTLATAYMGAALMGSINMSNVPMLLMGQMDKDISVFLYHKHYGKLPEYESDLQDSEIVGMLERLKGMYRRELQSLFNMGASDLKNEERHQQQLSKAQKARDLAKTAAAVREMNKPAPEGTVDELKERFGVSKSHIRMLKREGRLHELTQKAEQASA
jgi:hypothetical protein